MESKEDVDPNSQVKVTIDRPIRILHCSDGVLEEIEEHRADVLKNEPNSEESVDPKTLPWGSWFSHYAWKSGSKVLNAVDTAGESLANFFGITTPKYQIEIDEYERVKEEKKRIEEESTGWVAKNEGGDIPLVLNEPLKGISNSGSV